MRTALRSRRAAVIAFATAGLALAAQPGELIERTLAIVDGQVITLADVRTAAALGLVDRDGASADLAGTTSRLIDRLLMLREVQRYAPPEPAGAEIDRRQAIVRDRAGGPDALARALDAGGFSDAWLRAWIRDDLRIAAYLEQRFAGDRRTDVIADWIADLRRRTPVVELPRP